jgi:hypothetical protein
MLCFFKYFAVCVGIVAGIVAGFASPFLLAEFLEDHFGWRKDVCRAAVYVLELSAIVAALMTVAECGQ